MHILFDIGATKMRIAGTKDGKTFTEPLIHKTPALFADAMNIFKESAIAAAGSDTIESITGGLAGILDKDKTKLVFSHVTDWIGKPIRAGLSLGKDIPVRIENDAAVVGLGEAMHGAGKGKSIVAYMTVSSGVGGARIVDGRIDENRRGFEPGHQIIDAGGTLCTSCGAEGHLEGYVSGQALAKRLGVSPKEVTDPVIWDELSKWLSYGIFNTALFWSPDVIVLGGSMINGTPAIPFEKTVVFVNDSLRPFTTAPEIARGTLGDIGGIYGALALVADSMK